MKFGAHMSISGGLHKAFGHGERAGCDTIQIFSKNQQQWRAKPLADQDIALFKAEQQRTGFGPLIVHDSYLINLASPSDELWEKSIAAFGDELERGAALGIPYLVTHPGAHTGSGEETGLLREAAALNRLLDAGVGGPSTGSGQAVTILLETTAGQGSALGYLRGHVRRVRSRGRDRADQGVPPQRLTEGPGQPRRPPHSQRRGLRRSGRIPGDRERPALCEPADDPGDAEGRGSGRGYRESGQAAWAHPITTCHVSHIIML